MSNRLAAGASAHHSSAAEFDKSKYRCRRDEHRLGESTHPDLSEVRRRSAAKKTTRACGRPH